MQQRSSWARVIEAIDKPLGFYVLAVLIVESFLSIVLILSDLEAGVQEKGMWAGIGLFAFVVVTVSVFVWFKPTNLMFTELGTLVQMGKASYGTETKQVGLPDLPSGVRKRP